nr:unnamed protein product [Naegleria fowleri]
MPAQVAPLIYPPPHRNEGVNKTSVPQRRSVQELSNYYFSSSVDKISNLDEPACFKQQQQQQSSFDNTSLSDGQNNENEGKSVSYHLSLRSSRCFNCLLSLRTMLIVGGILIVLITAIAIWTTCFVVNITASNEQMQVMLNNLKDKVGKILDRELLVAKVASNLIVEDYYDGRFEMNDSSLSYLFNKMKIFLVTGVTFCFGEQGLNLLYGYTQNCDGSLLMARKYQNESNLYVYEANNKTGVPNYSKQVLSKSYLVNETDYYVESISVLRTQNHPDQGVFGSIYQVLNGPLSLYFSTPVYNKTQLDHDLQQERNYSTPMLIALKEKARIGICKINLALDELSRLISSVTVTTKGFIILSEVGNNNSIVASSVEPLRSENEASPMRRLSFSDLPVADILNILLTLQPDEHLLNPKRNGIDQSSEIFTISNYLVYSSLYTFENTIKWRLTMAVDSYEVNQGVIMSVYITIAVTAVIVTIGMIVSALVGWFLSDIFLTLQSDFKKVEMLDLQNIMPRTSLFTEPNNIYKSLTETVAWLNEFKSFLPDSVLNHIESEGEHPSPPPSQTHGVPTIKVDSHPRRSKDFNENAPTTTTQLDKKLVDLTKSIQSIDRHSLTSSTHDSPFTNATEGHSLFKIGLVSKECYLVFIAIPDMNESRFDHPQLLSNVICKVLNTISTLRKTAKADLQIRSHQEYLLVFNGEKAHDKALELSLKFQAAIRAINDSFRDAFLVSNNNINVMARNSVTVQNNNKNVADRGNPSMCNSSTDDSGGNTNSDLKAFISVTSGECLQGNVGGKTLRYFAIVGELVSKALDMITIGKRLNIPITVDSKTFLQARLAFVMRPCERILCRKKRKQFISFKHGFHAHLDANEDAKSVHQSQIETVYQLIRRNAVKDDEWLYELDQKTENEKHNSFTQQFHDIFLGNSKKGDESYESFMELLQSMKDSEDGMLLAHRLEYILTHPYHKNLNTDDGREDETNMDMQPPPAANDPDFSLYYTTIEKSVASFLKGHLMTLK